VITVREGDEKGDDLLPVFIFFLLLSRRGGEVTPTWTEKVHTRKRRGAGALFLFFLREGERWFDFLLTLKKGKKRW